MEESPKQTPARRVSRKRLVPWLKKHLDRGDIQGLQWRVKEERIWQMPWKIHKETTWPDPDAKMLQELAKLLYDFKDDVPTKINLQEWKKKIRCSLGSLKNDVKELEDQHDQTANPPYKVYQFIYDESEQVGRGHSRGQRGQGGSVQKDKVTKQRGSSDCSSAANTPSCSYSVSSTSSPSSSGDGDLSQLTAGLDAYLVQMPRLNKMGIQFPCTQSISQSQIPQTVLLSQATPQVSDTRSPVSAFPVDTTSAIQACTSAFTNQYQCARRERNNGENHDEATSSFQSYRSRSPVNITGDGIAGCSEHAFGIADIRDKPPSQSSTLNTHFIENPSRMSNEFVADALRSLELPSVNDNENFFEDDTMAVLVYYYDHVVMKQPIKKHKFRMCFVADDKSRETVLTCTNESEFGPQDAKLIELPLSTHCTDLTQEKQLKIELVLTQLERGFMIECSDTKDMYLTRYCKSVPFIPSLISDKPQKVKREERIKLFDFNNILKMPTHMHAAPPFVRLIFYYNGETNSACEEAIKIDIYHMEYLRMKDKALKATCPNEPVCSLSDDFDKQLKIVRDLKMDF